jgi:ribonuclease Z
MEMDTKKEQTWRGNYFTVRVLHSIAGIAQQIQVIFENGYLLVDAGDGVLRDLLSGERDIRDIKGILFTHGHYDHMGGLHSLLGFLRMIGREEPLQIFAPDGCEEVFSLVESFRSCYPGTIPFEISCHRVESEEILQVADLMIKAYPLVHCGSTKESGILDPIPAMGYRIWNREESIAISGDTGNCPFLKELVRDADLAILEATYPSRESVGEEYLEKVHLSEDLAREIGKLAKEVILVHRRKGSS